MKRYDKYKQSGISWIGEIPEHWGVKRLKYLLEKTNAGIWGNEPRGDGTDIICFRAADYDYERGILSFDKLTYRSIPEDQLWGKCLNKVTYYWRNLGVETYLL